MVLYPSPSPSPLPDSQTPSLPLLRVAVPEETEDAESAHGFLVSHLSLSLRMMKDDGSVQ